MLSSYFARFCYLLFSIHTNQAEGWSRTPDAVIAFGAPRLADKALSGWT